MATRLTGLTNGRGLGRPVAAVRSWSRLRQAVVGGIALLAILAACSSTSTYPLDYYTAMHYQHSFRTLEPPRFQSPDSAVPVQGRAPAYTSAEILQLENPVPADEASLARGQELYSVNCLVCHGEGGNGDGPMAQRLRDNGARSPAVLTADRLVGVEDNYFYNTMTNGLPPYMPSFANLIEGEDMWSLINYIRDLQAAAQ
jgi:mono/diheme cytochrome c family protein